MRSVFLTLFFIIYVCIVVTAQQYTLNFDSDGKFRYSEYTELKQNLIKKQRLTKTIKFVVENDSNSVFLIATTQAPNYVLPGIGTKPILCQISENTTDKKSQWEVSNLSWEIKIDHHANHLFYRIYKYPKELALDNLAAEFEYNQLLNGLLGNLNILLEARKKRFKDFLKSITVGEFVELCNQYDKLNKLKLDLLDANGSLLNMRQSKDSLSRKDQIEYHRLIAARNIYLQEIKSYHDFNTTDMAIKDLSEIRQKYLSALDLITQFEARKLAFRSNTINPLEEKVKKLEYEIATLKKEYLLEQYLNITESLEGLSNFSLDIAYEGYLNLSDNTKLVEYNCNLEAETDYANLLRYTPILPVLTDREYLGVLVHNVPKKLYQITGGIPFELNYIRDTSMHEQSLEVDEIKPFNRKNYLAHLDLSSIKISNYAQDSLDRTSMHVCIRDNKSIYNSNILDIKDAKLNTNSPCDILLQKHILAIKKERDRLLKSIFHFNVNDLIHPKHANFRDHTLSNGVRYDWQDKPVIVIYGKTNTKNRNQVRMRKNFVLANDTLDKVQRLYRFDISAGLLASIIPNYTYNFEEIEGTSFSRLVERKIYNTNVNPAIFFSGYLKEQNINSPPKFSPSLNIGLKISEQKIFNNFYLGLGAEVARHFQIIVGINAGKVDRMNPNTFDQLDNSFEKEEIWEIGAFVSTNFYLAVMPKLIQPLFNK